MRDDIICLSGCTGLEYNKIKDEFVSIVTGMAPVLQGLMINSPAVLQEIVVDAVGDVLSDLGDKVVTEHVILQDVIQVARGEVHKRILEDKVRKNKPPYQYIEYIYPDEFLKTLPIASMEIAFLRRERLKCSEIADKLGKSLWNVLAQLSAVREHYREWKSIPRIHPPELLDSDIERLKLYHPGSYKRMIEIIKLRLNGDRIGVIAKKLGLSKTYVTSMSYNARQILPKFDPYLRIVNRC
jgi:hypothetical protein